MNTKIKINDKEKQIEVSFSYTQQILISLLIIPNIGLNSIPLVLISVMCISWIMCMSILWIIKKQ